MPTFTLQKVHVVPKKKIKIKIKKKKPINLNTIKIPNIALNISDITDNSNKPFILEDIPEIQLTEQVKSPVSQDIEYEEHYVSFIVLHQLNYGFRKTEQPCNYIIGINILIKGNDIIHNYKISSGNFKYKKFIRETVRAQMNYKNKDIYLIKSLGVNKNFHNYIVILERYSKKHKQYKNVINDITANYKWKSVYDFYPNKELKQYEDEPCNNTLRNVYKYLYKNVNNISFTDKSKANNITVKEVYNILKDVI